MRVRSLWLTDFRSYGSAELELSPGFTVLVGPNGAGKTNLLEALGWLATLSSFRGAPTEALIRQGQAAAVVRASVEHENREVLIETQLSARGRNRVQVNRQPLRRARDLLGTLRVTVFTPDDLTVVKTGPSERRRLIDDGLVGLQPRYHALRADLDKVLRQRGALLKQSGGRLDESATFTLDVWDSKLVEAGGELARARVDLLERLRPAVTETYRALANKPGEVVGLSYESSWLEDGLAKALERARTDDVRRGVTTVGPHRDDIALSIGGLPARTHASQGEQRTLALALRLGLHRVITEETGSAPVFLLDDVFSELDPQRSEALVTNLPEGQVVLTTASDVLPLGVKPDELLRIVDGDIVGG